MFSLAPYQIPMQATPQPVLQAVKKGVYAVNSFAPPQQAEAVLGVVQPPENTVLRAADGRVLVLCVTDMPDVTPAMIDWWFGWHMPESARYALWHPRAHIKSRAREDRTHYGTDKEKYIGNVSWVDEFIGSHLKKLVIAFVEPQVFGIGNLTHRGATAICAYTSDRVLHGQGGCLIHYVVSTASGAQMRSGFWLGDMQHHQPLLNKVLSPLLNTPFVRKRVVSDRMALDLLLHCGEEMNHLARFLPALYRQAHQQRSP